MVIFKKVADIKNYISYRLGEGKKVSFVPTMVALIAAKIGEVRLIDNMLLN